MATNDTNSISPQASAESSGPFLARVISHQDPNYMGVLEVELLRPGGNSSSEGQLHQVKYMSPFYGVTGVNHTTENNDYNGTQKSYGMWMIPPDPGTTVVVFFIDGDPKRGYWMGCVPDDNMNFMVPGIAATEYQIGGTAKRVPVAEYNKTATQSVPSDSTKAKKPAHPLAAVLEKQGLLKDDTRGITTSSARRETPSMVFGISTPGPIDKRTNAQRGAIGKAEHKIKDAFVSRLGGTTFVMDDGDANFLRKKPASEAGPDYAAAEQGERGGNVEIPHNELFRIRTRTGHQILLHNSEDLIYIGNASGTTWIEMTSNGKIDIYAKDSVSVHSQNDINFTADRDINFTALGNINMNAGLAMFATTGTALEINVGTDGKLSAGTAMNIKSGTNTNLTSGADLNLKAGAKWMQSGASYWTKPAGGGGSSEVSAVAPTAAKAPKAVRIPQAEPWNGHENLDPFAFTPANTKAAATPPKTAAPTKYQQYTTVTDTFSKVKGADKK